MSQVITGDVTMPSGVIATKISIQPRKVRRVQIDRHDFGFKLVLSGIDGIAEDVELILDAEGMKTLISALTHPRVVSVVKEMAPDQITLMTDLENLGR